MNRSTLLIIVFSAALVGCGQRAGSDSASAGKEIFDQYCAQCHGPAGNVRLAEYHDPNTPDLRRIAERSPQGRLPRIMLAEIIDGRRIVQAHGNRTMPKWGEQLDVEGSGTADDKVQALVNYIESIQTK
jgi:mono/diheme cytochrome c family protein